MPLAKGSSKKAQGARFHDFRHGKTYKKTERKFGKEVANKQLVAVSLGGKGGKKAKSREAKTKKKVVKAKRSKHS